MARRSGFQGGELATQGEFGVVGGFEFAVVEAGHGDQAADLFANRGEHFHLVAGV